MLLRYWKTAQRYLARHFSFSLINILGLSIGIASCMLIYAFVHSELTYDGYNVHAGRIARVTSVLHSPESDMAMAISPTPLADALLRDCPELESAVRLEPVSVIIRKGPELIKEQDCHFSEQNIFNVFTFTFLEGSAAGALTAPHSIVLTKSLADKYFGGAPALGKTLVCDGQPLRVTAVIADRPPNSDMTIRALLPKDFTKATHWVVDDLSVYTFLLFRGKPDYGPLEARLAAISASRVQPELDRAQAIGYHLSFVTEALADLHFSQGKLADTPKGSRSFNAVFSALAAFILIIALLNYINLSTAKATERAKEVGVRKVIGARPAQLVRQFLGGILPADGPRLADSHRPGAGRHSLL